MYQIVRIKQIRKSGINAIGGEEWRENGCRRSPNLDERRTHLNVALRDRKKHGLERGERRTQLKHIDQMKYAAEKLKEENAELERTNDAYLEHNKVLRNAAETYESLLKKPSSDVDISIKNAQLGIELDRKKKISKKKEQNFERTFEAIKNYVKNASK